MGRVKIPMLPINDSKKRKITFVRRKDGIFKKARELATLCDVDVSMIISSDHQVSPEIFPQDFSKLNDMIEVYKRYRTNDPGKIKSNGVELAKAEKQDLEAKYPTWFDFLDTSSQIELKDFTFGLGMRIDEVKKKIEDIKLEKNFKVENFDVQDFEMKPFLKPSPMTFITPNEYTNCRFGSDGITESCGSSSHNVDDNGYYPIMLMDQSYDHVALYRDSMMMSVDDNICFEPEVFLQQLEQQPYADMN